jgi:hypothetical protein
MGFIAIIGGFTLIVSLDSYRSYSFRSDRDLLVTALLHARSLAVGNVCSGAACTEGKPHGVSIQPNQFVIFQGATYATRDVAEDAVIQANPAITHSGLPEVVFTELSANPNVTGSITLTDPVGNSSVVTIGAEGQIFWTK